MDRQKFNDQAAEKRTRNKGHWEREQRIKIILKLIGKEKKVLDLACFDGRISQRIKDHGNAVTGMEISSLGAQKCRERGIECIQHDIEKPLPIEPNTFDCVFAGEIIEHIYDTDNLLQEIGRILKPNGYAILTTPNIAALSRRLRLLIGSNPNIDIGLKNSAGHIRYFTRESLKQLLERNNFKVTDIQADYLSLNILRSSLAATIAPSLANGIIIKAKIKK